MSTILGQKTGVIATSDNSSNSEEYGKNGSTTCGFFCWTADEANQKVSQLNASGWKCSTTQDGIGWRISATLNVNLGQNPEGPTSTIEPTSQWSLTRNIVEENLLEADREVIKELTTLTKESIRLALKNPGKQLPIVEKLYASNTNYVKGANEVYSLMAMGMKSRRIITKTLKRTITVSEMYNTTWLNNSEGKVIGTPTMISRYNIPISVSCLMPNPSVKEFILNSGDNNIMNRVYVNYGWLDLGVDRNFSNNGNVQISQEWEYGKWSNLAYDVI